MSDPRDLNDLYEELWSMEYRISGDKPSAKAFARDFLGQYAHLLAEPQRDLARRIDATFREKGGHAFADKVKPAIGTIIDHIDPKAEQL